jgi:hypothetical protein
MIGVEYRNIGWELVEYIFIKLFLLVKLLSSKYTLGNIADEIYVTALSVNSCR